jgi:hypothetical protein
LEIVQGFGTIFSWHSPLAFFAPETLAVAGFSFFIDRAEHPHVPAQSFSSAQSIVIRADHAATSGTSIPRDAISSFWRGFRHSNGSFSGHRRVLLPWLSLLMLPSASSLAACSSNHVRLFPWNTSGSSKRRVCNPFVP